jgi:hypothetical protein
MRPRQEKFKIRARPFGRSLNRTIRPIARKALDSERAGLAGNGGAKKYSLYPSRDNQVKPGKILRGHRSNPLAKLVSLEQFHEFPFVEGANAEFGRLAQF